MKTNTSEISGVVHQSQSASHYHLRRYFPAPEFEDLIEQFWFVDWDLTDKPAHIQKNLPDPNFHLILEKHQLKLIGPVSKAYEYKMQGKGQLLGVKFVIGSLIPHLSMPAGNYLDRELAATQVLDIGADDLLTDLHQSGTDEEKVHILQTYLRSLVSPAQRQQNAAKQLLALMVNNTDIVSVNQLASHAGMPVRTIQRIFQQYVGLSPKLLLRKYRLHQAIALLDSGEKDMADIVTWLAYSDQSHLIHDFKDMLGITPKQYNG